MESTSGDNLVDSPAGPRPVEDYLSEAEAHAVSGDARASLRALDRLIKDFEASEEPSHVDHVARAQLFKALTFAQLGEFDRARSSLNYVFESYRNSETADLRALAAHARRAEADVLQDMGTSTLEAIDLYEDVVELFGEDVDAGVVIEVATARIDSAEAYLGIGEVPAARIAAEKAIASIDSPGMAPSVELMSRARLLQADALARLGHTGEAFATYDALIVAATSNPECGDTALVAVVNKGVALLDADRFSEALETLDSGTALAERLGVDPDNETLTLLHDNRALVLRKMAAGAAGEATTALDPRNPSQKRIEEASALLDAAAELEEAGQLEKAASKFSEVVVLFEHDATQHLEVAVALAARCQVLARMFEYQKSIDAADEILQRFSADTSNDIKIPIARALLIRAASNYELGRRDKALADCDALTAMATPNNTELLRLAKLGAELRESVTET